MNLLANVSDRFNAALLRSFLGDFVQKVLLLLSVFVIPIHLVLLVFYNVEIGNIPGNCA